jgi:hypothetical protein
MNAPSAPGSGGARHRAPIMRRRHFLLAAPFAAASVALHRPARAAEAATPQAGDAGGLTEAERLIVGQRMRRENFTLAGDIRRKGSLIVAVALQNGASWRVVVDSRTGEIVGRRLLTETIAWPR